MWGYPPGRHVQAIRWQYPQKKNHTQKKYKTLNEYINTVNIKPWVQGLRGGG